MGKWLVAHVRSRHEKALAIDCEAMGIGYYLPLCVKRVRRRDTNKLRKSVLPLFPGYVPFVNEGDSRIRILETGRVAGILEIADQKRFIQDLEQIRRVVEAGISVDGVEEFATGQTVRITRGPLEGLKGVVRELQSTSRILLNVDAFKMAVAVELDTGDIEAIDE